MYALVYTTDSNIYMVRQKTLYVCTSFEKTDIAWCEMLM